MKMIQCKDCELCEMTPDGKRSFKCDPFSNIKEAECIQKWQLIRLDMLLAGYQTMISSQKKFAPMQDKIMKYMKREIDDMEDSEEWKYSDQDDDEKPLL
jgi:hypothetical protein